MPRVERITDWRRPIPEGYFSKLDSLVSSRGWPARNSNTSMTNVRREVDQLNVDIDDMIRWRDRIYAAIHSGTVNLVCYIIPKKNYILHNIISAKRSNETIGRI